MVDDGDRVQVPPGQDDYWLRRIWITAEEEQGYYYGFANEGLWPLCHLAYVRPAFREDDWKHYVAVNRRFADVVASEAGDSEPVVLIQDFHFALLPNARVQMLPGSRHRSDLDSPRAFNAALLGFLGSVPIP